MPEERDVLAMMPVHDTWPVRVIIGTFAVVMVLLSTVVAYRGIVGKPIIPEAKEVLIAVIAFLSGVLTRTSSTPDRVLAATRKKTKVDGD
jgi:hypothetical protein